MSRRYGYELEHHTAAAGLGHRPRRTDGRHAARPLHPTAEALDLADRVRDPVEAVVWTDVDAVVRADTARRVADLTALPGAARRPQAVSPIRYRSGRLEHLTQMGSGRLSPQASRPVFEEVEPRPDPAADPESVEIRAHRTLTAAHGGPPARVHAGIVAVVLDRLLGVAASTAGAPGLAAGTTCRWSRPVAKAARASRPVRSAPTMR